MYADESGPAVARALRDLGFDVAEAAVVADGDPVAASSGNGSLRKSR